jgi:hypothetical protein
MYHSHDCPFRRFRFITDTVPIQHETIFFFPDRVPVDTVPVSYSAIRYTGPPKTDLTVIKIQRSVFPNYTFARHSKTFFFFFSILLTELRLGFLSGVDSGTVSTYRRMKTPEECLISFVIQYCTVSPVRLCSL